MEIHHIIKRSQAPYMKDVKINLIELTPEDHRGTNGVHGKNGYIKDKELKRQLQNKLEVIFDSHYINREEVKYGLEGINDRQLDKLLKTLSKSKKGYVREDLIRRCMGGRLY